MEPIVGKDSVIFGLRYLEEESVDIQDVIGCMGIDPNNTVYTLTDGDDTDSEDGMPHPPNQ